MAPCRPRNKPNKINVFRTFSPLKNRAREAARRPLPGRQPGVFSPLRSLTTEPRLLADNHGKQSRLAHPNPACANQGRGTEREPKPPTPESSQPAREQTPPVQTNRGTNRQSHSFHSPRPPKKNFRAEDEPSRACPGASRGGSGRSPGSPLTGRRRPHPRSRGGGNARLEAAKRPEGWT